MGTRRKPEEWRRKRKTKTKTRRRSGRDKEMPR
jgi:hypothetical protein